MSYEHGFDSQWLQKYGCLKCSMSRCGCVYRQVIAPAVLQLANSAVRLVVTSLNYEHVDMHFSYMFCNGNTDAAIEEYW
jgi:hypothetical protein